MRKMVVILGIVCMAIGGVAFAFADGEDKGDGPKYTIKQVMKEAHGKKLLNKVVAGDATSEEKVKLLDLYLAMLENKPGKGDADSWHEKAGTTVIAAAKVVVGREGAGAELKKAANCSACHKVHK